MKTIEEKTKDYDEAIERARKLKENPKAIFFEEKNVHVSDYIFPELKESEEERIRKEIKDFFSRIMLGQENFLREDYDWNAWIAWLEKQGKSAFETAKEEKVDNQNCVKPADKVKPKFKIEKDKWYVCIKDLLDSYANKAFHKGDTYLSTQDGSLMPSNSNVPFEVVCPDTYFRDWTIQDAQNGDVLVASDGSIFLFKGTIDGVCKHYAALTVDKVVKFNEGLEHCWESSRAVHPANKEERELLFQKMQEAGYEWDTEKKELKKIEQNPVWNEEDEKFINDIEESLIAYKILVMDNDMELADYIEKEIDWLKLNKERTFPQSKKEWSEKDSPYYDDICEILINLIHSNTDGINKDAVQKDLDWLISLIENRVKSRCKFY